MSARKLIGQILLEHGVVDRAQLEAALAAPRGGMPLASALVDRGAVSEVDALKALSEQLGVPGIDVGQVIIRLADLDLLPREVAAGHRLLPVLAREDRLFCAMAVPTDAKILDELEFVTGKRVFAYVALNAPLARVIDDAYAAKEQGSAYYVGPRTPDEALARAGIPASMRASGGGTPTPSPPTGTAAARPATSSASTASRKEVPAPAPSIPKAPPAPELRNAPLRERTSERGARLEASFRPSSPSIPALDSHVVVDDAMRRSVEGGDASIAQPDTTFQTNSEMSVVAPFPLAPMPRKEGQKVVLVVDDDADIRRLLRTVLAERGHRVVEADRGLLALQLVKQDPPDLMLLDVMLPEVHGFEIARRIRGSERYGDIPIIMISAVYRGAQVAQDAKTGYGVDAFIEKPFRIAEVVKAVDAALNRVKHHSEPKRDPAQAREEAQRLLADGMAAYQTGDITRAIDLLERGAKIDPLSYRLRYHLGLLYGKGDRIYDAIRELERATELNPRQYPAWKNVAVLYQQAGFRAKAVRAWEKAADLAPDDATRQAIHKQIAALGSA